MNGDPQIRRPLPLSTLGTLLRASLPNLVNYPG